MAENEKHHYAGHGAGRNAGPARAQKKYAHGEFMTERTPLTAEQRRQVAELKSSSQALVAGAAVAAIGVVLAGILAARISSDED